MEVGESQGAFDVLDQVEFSGGAADGEVLQARFSRISVERSDTRRSEIDQRLAALTLEVGWKADRLGQRV